MAIGPVDTGDAPLPERATAYAWAVFALTFALLLSDYMARQVLNAVFPLLKAEWALTDQQLGLLSGVVAISVGVLAFPLSLVADRWGRVASLTAMAALWSIATLICGIAQSYEQMLAGRVLVGVGEAAYGSVGLAVVMSAFPLRMRATLSGLFFAGSLLGQVVGVAAGGAIGAQLGWRAAFIVIAVAGLVLAFAYPLVVRESRIRALAPGGGQIPAAVRASPWRQLGGVFRNRTVWFTFVGNGVQCYMIGALAAWAPTYFVRYYDLPLDRAGTLAGVFLLLAGIGTAACGTLADRAARARPERKAHAAVGYALASAAALAAALALAPGTGQLVLLGVAFFFGIGTIGPSSAIAANVTPAAVRGTVFALSAFANNIFGLAPGPILTGRLADSIGLLDALRFVPLAGLIAAICFALAARSYAAERRADQG